MSDELNDGWKTWLNQNLKDMSKGSKVMVPKHLLHPALSGFKKLALAEYAGQKSDWVYPLEPHARLHVHEFTSHLDGHIDEYDPERGLFFALFHFIYETKIGSGLSFLSVTLLSYLMLRLSRKLLNKALRSHD